MFRASAAASLSTGTLVAFTILACGLSGCGSNSTVLTQPSGPTPYSGAAFSGHAASGSQPLIAASLQLYASGASGAGSAATALLSTPLTTDASGAFSVPAGYTCSSAAAQLYLVARGGKPGAATSANSAIVFVAALGACSQIAGSAKFTVNEVTTAAGAYALAQFLSPGANIGATPTNSVGIANAFATAARLADVTLGLSPGPSFAANGSSPAPMLNAVANMLNGCAVAGPSAPACTALFSATTASGSAPSNTLDAALSLVRHPGANAAALYALSTASSAFAPVIAAPPPDWTLPINFTGGGMNSPTGLGIDSLGNVWVANYVNVASEFANTGAPVYAHGLTGAGLSASYGLAVDANNNAWIPNEPSPGLPGDSVTVFNSSGQAISGSAGYTSGGLDYPVAVAIDTDGSAWLADYGDSHVTHLSSSGVPLSGASGYSDASIAFPAALAIDTAHNVWIGNNDNSVTRVSPNGTQFAAYICCNNASALAFDQQGNLWVANYYGDSVSEISSAGTVVSAGAYTGGGLHHPQGLAIDGAGNIWIANFRANALTELAGAQTATPGAAISGAGGIGGAANLVAPFALAIDSSGNLWVTNFGSNVLTEYIGIAAPVKTPLIGPSQSP